MGVNPLSHGSSRVRLGTEMTDILCSVKAELAQQCNNDSDNHAISLDVRVMCDCGADADQRDLIYSSRELTCILREYVVDF